MADKVLMVPVAAFRERLLQLSHKVDQQRNSRGDEAKPWASGKDWMTAEAIHIAEEMGVPIEGDVMPVSAEDQKRLDAMCKAHAVLVANWGDNDASVLMQLGDSIASISNAMRSNAAGRTELEEKLIHRCAELWQTLLNIKGEMNRRSAHLVTNHLLADDYKPRIAECKVLCEVLTARMKAGVAGDIRLGQDAFKDPVMVKLLGEEGQKG